MRRRGLSLGALTVAVVCLVGMLAGLGVSTFGYGAGHAYLSDDPAACIQCHIMQPQYDSWLNSSHSAHATCNDCHLPHDFFGRWTAKADNGFFHSWAFTFQDFHEPIQIKRRNLEILQNNCIRCHESMVHGLLPLAPPDEGTSCMQCHGSVGHGARSAGQPRRFY